MEMLGNLVARSQARLARIAGEDGISHSHIANLISGRDHPSSRVLELLAAALKVEPERFAERGDG